ncbi:MAG TPA: hypothetical protein VF170_03740 [Planctomycetaceae bacterium]
MDTLSLLGNLASIAGLLITVFTLVEVVRTKHWARRKLSRANHRWRLIRLADRIDQARRVIRQMLDVPTRLREDTWRNELREALSEIANESSLSVGDKGMMRRAVRGLYVPVKDSAREADRLRELLVYLAGLHARVTADVAPESEE